MKNLYRLFSNTTGVEPKYVLQNSDIFDAAALAVQIINDIFGNFARMNHKKNLVSPTLPW